jgi:hypothetical protein
MSSSGLTLFSKESRLVSNVFNSFGICAGMTNILVVVAMVLGGGQVQAADLSWGGSYRVEALKIKNSELSSADSNKAYILHHLVLAPKLVAADGLTIHSRLDLLNDPNFGIDANGRIYSVAGDLLGGGPGAGLGNTTSTSDSNVLGRSQRAANLAITSLYASWIQEFGQLVVGRTPIHFGLGTAFNAGNGIFDHYLDTKDLVGYKIVLGNFFLFPMAGKVSEGILGEEDDVNDYLVHLQYDNPETDLSLGVIYQVRTSTFAGNDVPVGADFGGAGATRVDGGKSTTLGLFSSQKVGLFTIGVEADFLTGETGIRTADGANVSLNAYGVAGEVAWSSEESKLSAGVKLGLASGDDPNTSRSYEGFAFSRNYDVGMLMFNHPLGQRDFLRTNVVRNASGTGAGAPNQQIDSEALSNALYIAPGAQYQWKDHLSVGGTLIYGMLNTDPITTGAGEAGTAKDLGFEIDLNVTYKPFQRLTWVTEFAALLPGQAWKAGSLNLDNKFAYGFTTKAAISF